MCCRYIVLSLVCANVLGVHNIDVSLLCLLCQRVTIILCQISI